MIKILFFIPTLSGGGAEKVLCNLVNNMNQEEFDITVQTIESCNPESLLRKGIHYKMINHRKSRFTNKLFSYWFRFCAEFKLAYTFFVKDNYDIEVAYLETIPTKIIAQSTNAKAKKIAWVHCDLSKKEGMKKAASKIRDQYKQFDKIVCVSEDVRVGFQELLGVEINTVVIPNVIDEDEICSKAMEPICWQRESNEIRLIAVGRLTQQKNFSYLVDTCAKLRDTGNSFSLNILGEGPERKRLEQQIISLNLESIVKLRGFVSNPYPWLQQSDIVVCSSEYEGISTVVQEALILNKPIVTTPCTGMSELLGQSEYGMIVSPSTDGLFKGLYQMINSKELRNYYSQKARERSLFLKKSVVIRTTQDFFIETLQ